jgi:hypothetical protein
MDIPEDNGEKDEEIKEGNWTEEGSWNKDDGHWNTDTYERMDMDKQQGGA